MEPLKIKKDSNGYPYVAEQRAGYSINIKNEYGAYAWNIQKSGKQMIHSMSLYRGEEKNFEKAYNLVVKKLKKIV